MANFNASRIAYFLIGLMDGDRTLQQIWDIVCERFEDDLPTQDEVIQLVGQLNQANVIQTDVLPDIAILQQRRESEQRRKWLQQLKSPLSIRIPLLDPEGFCPRRNGWRELSLEIWCGDMVYCCRSGHGYGCHPLDEFNSELE
ncbi:PqqD family protein [Vibrio taketomensis]|uniref:PqqD family protein n=1 Tax=Vibrio taketomensis TaxID=2572923 RepID=UPI001E28EDA4|nr:PqqD family protein [Vibrio taketomensis]